MPPKTKPNESTRLTSSQCKPNLVRPAPYPYDYHDELYSPRPAKTKTTDASTNLLALPKKITGGTAQLIPSILNLINNILGAGLFSMPWILKQASIGSGVLLLLFCAILNAFSFVIISKCCTYTIITSLTSTHVCLPSRVLD